METEPNEVSVSLYQAVSDLRFLRGNIEVKPHTLTDFMISQFVERLESAKYMPVKQKEPFWLYLQVSIVGIIMAVLPIFLGAPSQIRFAFFIMGCILCIVGGSFSGGAIRENRVATKQAEIAENRLARWNECRIVFPGGYIVHPPTGSTTDPIHLGVMLDNLTKE